MKKLVLRAFALLTLMSLHECQLRMSLHRMKSLRDRMIEKHLSAANMYKSFHPKPTPLYPNTTVPLQKFMDTDFYGVIRIGSPPQNFRAIFDTAWADTCVASTKCPYFDVCYWAHKYDSTKSNKYVEIGTPYSSGGSQALKGFLSSDEISVGTPQVTVENMTFAEVTHMPLTMWNMKADGIVGMSFPELSRMKLYYTFPEMLMAQGQILNPIFSVYINRDPKTSEGGAVLFGASDPKHHRGQNVIYIAVSSLSTGYWQFSVQSISVVFNINKTRAVCTGGCQGVLDTGSSGILGPETEIIKLNRWLNAVPFMFGRYKVDCKLIKQLPEISIKIVGLNFTLKGKDYIQEKRYADIDVCLSPFIVQKTPKGFENFWFFGTLFMAKYYSIFDFGRRRVGLAASYA